MNYELALKLKEAGFPQRDDYDSLGIELSLGRSNHPTGGYHLLMDESYLIEKIGSENCKKRRAYCWKLEYLANDEKTRALMVYIPTLSELIESCGLDLGAIVRDDDPNSIETVKGWTACAYVNGYDGALEKPKSFGLSPEEAVANFWLALPANHPNPA